MPQESSQTDAKQMFVSELGELAWDENWEALSQLSPELFEASINLIAVPIRKRDLPLKVQHFISIAVDSASTHLYTSGIQQHVRAALYAGATCEEVIEVIELTSTLGIHACNVGIPLLVDVMKEEGIYDQHDPAGKPLDEQRQGLRKQFTEKRGYWHRTWEEFLELDPEFFEAYMNFSSVPWVKGSGKGYLSPKIKELIHCAFDAAATHLYVTGLRLHMKNTIGYGATPEEILEVLEIATQLSLHTAHTSAPILKSILAERSSSSIR